MNVLSLFNGCGMLSPALSRAGIETGNFYSSEIDKHANKIADKNYPDTIQLGDVTRWKSWELQKIDLLTAGFPCQDLSCAGKQKGLDGERSGLLYEVLKIRDAQKPKYFLFENVASMSDKWREEITRLVGVNPVELNSKYWGAQNRKRLFWTNIPGAKNIEMMQAQNDKKMYLKDILIDGPYTNQSCKESPVCVCNVNPSGKGMNGNVFSPFGKSPTLTTNKGEGIKILHDNEIRKLRTIECERLMNLSDDYTAGVSNSQRYKMIGNGWDVFVVADLLKGIVEPVVDIQTELFFKRFL